MSIVKKHLFTALRITALTGICLLGLTMFGNAAPGSPATPNQAVSQLVNTLKAQGVEVKTAEIQKISPLIIAVALSDTHDSMTNAVNIHLARREAAMAYRSGVEVSGIEFSIPDAANPQKWWGQSFFDKNDSEHQRQPFGISALSAEEAAQRLHDVLRKQSPSITIGQITLEESPLAGRYERTLKITAFAPNVGDAAVYPSLIRQEIVSANKGGVNIAMAKVKIINPKGEIILDYFWDEEMRTELSLAAPGLDLGRPNPPTSIKQ